MARFVKATNQDDGKRVLTVGHVSSSFDLSDDVADKILKAQATVLAEEQRKNAGEMLNLKGYGKGYTKAKVEVSSPYTRGGVRLIQIRFRGKRPDGKSAAEIAYLNEFGVGDDRGARIPARGFIAKANAAKDDEINEIAADMVQQWTEGLLDE